MSRAEGPQADSTAGVNAQPKLTAAWRVRSVEACPGASLRVCFSDGTSGEVRLEGFLGSASVRGTVFEALRDASVFAAVRVVCGAVGWPNGAELAPDAMYDAIRATGTWVVEA